MKQQIRAWEPMERAIAIPPTKEQLAALVEAGYEEVALSKLQSEVWRNHKYTVHVTRRTDDDSVVELSIKRNDRKAAHDWRDFQRIKNEIAGEEIEAFELYPAMSRLMDTANQYYLFCLRPGDQISAGLSITARSTTAEAAKLGAAQRELPADWRLE